MAADAFREEGAVVVDAVTVHHAAAILRHFRFDVLAVDYRGLGIGIIKLRHDLGVSYPDMCISVIGPQVDSDVLARFDKPHAPDRQATCSEERPEAGDAKHHCEGGSDPPPA